jgi:hypothetical protein
MPQAALRIRVQQSPLLLVQDKARSVVHISLHQRYFRGRIIHRDGGAASRKEVDVVDPKSLALDPAPVLSDVKGIQGEQD